MRLENAVYEPGFEINSVYIVLFANKLYQGRLKKKKKYTV